MVNLLTMQVLKYVIPLSQTQLQHFHQLAENLAPTLLPEPDWFSSRCRTDFFQLGHWWCTQTVCRPVHLLTKSEKVR